MIFILATLSALAIVSLYYLWKLDCDLVLFLCSKFGRTNDCLKDKVVWIVGASLGIGAELAVDLAMAGSKLVLSATRRSNLEETKRRCLKVNGRLSDKDILVIPFDITDISSHVEHLNNVIKHFGKLDILVNNAARLHMGRFEETELDVDRKDFEINVFGLINLARAATNYWLSNKLSGHHVVTSSIGGFLPIPGSSTYSATKFAVQGYFENMRLELFNRNIDVTVVCPGPVDTELFDKSLTTRLNEVAAKKSKPPMKLMTAERCAELYTVAIVNKLDEAWIISNPFLAAVYIGVTFPTFMKFVGKRILTEKRLADGIKGKL